MSAEGDIGNGGEHVARDGPRTRPVEPDPEPDPPTLCVDVVRLGGDWAAIEPVEVIVGAIVGALSKEIELCGETLRATLALSTDAHVRELNRTHRGKDASTNVLSFPAPAIARGPGADDFLGDVVIAAETLSREAALETKPLAHHFQHLVLHGLLHLAGFDHESDEDAAEMEDVEVAVLRRLGVPDPYRQLDNEEQTPGSG